MIILHICGDFIEIEDVVCDFVCSIDGGVYDVLGHVMPYMTTSHSGMKFSTPYVDNNLLILNCASDNGGSWWYTKGSLFCPTVNAPGWWVFTDSNWYIMKEAHMMIKPQ